MVSPCVSRLQAFVSFFRLVRHALRQVFFVVGTAARHLFSFVSHFVAHFCPELPAKHLAYAVWNCWTQTSRELGQFRNACFAARMQSRVAGLNGCGRSVVVVLVLVLVVVVLLMVVVLCACPVPRSKTTLARIPTVMVFDTRNIGRLHLRAARTRRVGPRVWWCPRT